MAQIIQFTINKRHIRRLAEREIEKMYAASAGGQDRIIDVRSQELFESGHIDEPRAIDWPEYCVMILARLWEG